MRVPVNYFATLGVIAAAGLGPLSNPARADTPGTPATSAEDRWIPSLALESGLLIQQWDSEASSFICRECSIPDPAMQEEPLREKSSGGDLDVTPFVGANLELMTPALPVPTSPRLFVSGGSWASFGIERILAGEGNPGIVRSPLPPGNIDTGFTDAGALGQGTRVTAQMDTFGYGASGGFAFPFQFRGRDLLLKPSFGWIRYEIEIENLIVDAECRPQGTRSECNVFLPNNPGFLRPIELAADGSETFDAIGPGLDVALDTGRFGPVGSSLFIGFRAYRVLGDRGVDFPIVRRDFDDAAGADSTEARFGFEVDPWIFRAAIGLRFSWLGTSE